MEHTEPPNTPRKQPSESGHVGPWSKNKPPPLVSRYTLHTYSCIDCGRLFWTGMSLDEMHKRNLRLPPMQCSLCAELRREEQAKTEALARADVLAQGERIAARVEALRLYGTYPTEDHVPTKEEIAQWEAANPDPEEERLRTNEAYLAHRKALSRARTKRHYQAHKLEMQAYHREYRRRRKAQSRAQQGSPPQGLERQGSPPQETDSQKSRSTTRPPLLQRLPIRQLPPTLQLSQP